MRGSVTALADLQTQFIHCCAVGEQRRPKYVFRSRARPGKTASVPCRHSFVMYAPANEPAGGRQLNNSVTGSSPARKRERKPSATARRQTARPAARMDLHFGCTLADGYTQRRRLAQQRAQRQTALAALLAQRREEGMKPAADAIDGAGVTPLFAECAGPRGMVTQRPHHVTARGTRRFQRDAGKTGAQKSMHGFTSRQCTARRQVRRNAHGR